MEARGKAEGPLVQRSAARVAGDLGPRRDEALRVGHGGRRPQPGGPPGGGHGVPRAERRRQEHHAADRPRPRDAHRGLGDRARDAVPEPARTRPGPWAPCSRRRASTRLRSGRNHLRVLASASGIPQRRVDEVLELVGLAAAARRNAGTYSLGMRQRLGLGAALLGDPRILILDEPANGLDPQGIRWLRDLLRDFAAEGNAVLVSSHVLAEMAQLADEAIVISRGRLVRQAPIDELTSGSRRLRVVTPEDAPAGGRLRERGSGS